MTPAKAESRNTIRRALQARLVAAGLAVLCGAIARADSEDEIARCARITSLAERVTCLEDALRRTDGPSDGAPPLAVAEFGLDESREHSESPESIRVTVIDIEESAYGKLRYVTEDGQIWQQIDQRAPRYDDLPFPAEIRTAAAGSYFLQPVTGGIAVRVQRKQ